MQILETWDRILLNLDIKDSQYYTDYADIYPNVRMFYHARDGMNAFIIASINEEFGDFETPYGYGSFYSDTDNEQFMNEFFEEFHEACVGLDLTAGIIRFNPLQPLPDAPFDIIPVRHIAVVSNVRKYENLMSRKCKAMLNRASKLNLELYFSGTKEDYIDFHKIYKKKMIEKNAQQDLLFDTDYFLNMYNRDIFHLCIARENEKPVGGAVFVIKKDCVAYYHLSAVENSSAYPGLSNRIIAEGLNLSRIMKCPAMNLGGGITDKPDDSLLKFKKSFSNELLPFSLGKVVINRDEYERRIKEYDDRNEQFKNYHLRYRYD